MKIGDRVIVDIPNKKSRFDGKEGILKYRSSIRGRWFVHLDDDPRTTETEFCEDELRLRGK